MRIVKDPLHIGVEPILGLEHIRQTKDLNEAHWLMTEEYLQYVVGQHIQLKVVQQVCEALPQLLLFFDGRNRLFVDLHDGDH